VDDLFKKRLLALERLDDELVVGAGEEATAVEENERRRHRLWSNSIDIE
jgi:hypothetical protein